MAFGTDLGWGVRPWTLNPAPVMCTGGAYLLTWLLFAPPPTHPHDEVRKRRTREDQDSRPGPGTIWGGAGEMVPIGLRTVAQRPLTQPRGDVGTPRALTQARRVTPGHLSPSLRFPRAILSRSGRGLPIPLRNVPHVRQGSVLCSPPLCPRPQAGGRRLSSTRGPTAEDPSQGRDLITLGEEVPGT